MSMKKGAYNWIWKWHLIGGLVSFPVVFILAITGIIYLFKDQYEEPRYALVKEVNETGEKLTFEAQWQNTRQLWDRKINSMVIPKKENQATEFVSGRFSGKSSLFVNPYTGESTGKIIDKEADMFKVRKLHGELLSGSLGTKIVELAGSWLIVLIISGLFLFFPRRKQDWIQLFRIRFYGSKQILFRDLHMVGGFWFSIVLLVILAGGMPWTDVWGDGFKWIQKQTGTGYPATWQGRGINSTLGETIIPLDDVVDLAQSMGLPGEITISTPRSPKGVFSIHNIYHMDQSQQVAIHVDQYSGKPIASLQWEDVGFLMRARMWAMAFHQGQFGLWNWLLVLFTAIGLLVLSTSAILSYFLRKKYGSWGLPQSETYKVGIGLCMLLLALGILFPLFGMSIILIWSIERLRKLKSEGFKNRPTAA